MIYTGPGPTHFGVGPNNFGYGGNPYYNQPNIPGYMPGYYNGNYNMYNPFYYQQIQQQQQEAYNNYIKQQQEISNRLTAGAYQYTGTDIPDRMISNYSYTDEQRREIYQYQQEGQKAQYIDYRYREAKENSKSYIKDKKLAFMRNVEVQKEADDSLVSKDADLYEFMENGYKLNLAIDQRERQKKEQDLRQLYNQNSYQALLNMHNNIAGYRNVYDNIQPISIDDMEVSLPSHLATNDEYIARRNAFINRILNKE